MVPHSGIPDKVDAKAFNWVCDELNVVYRMLEAAQQRVQWMAFAAGGLGITVGLFIGWFLWSG